MSYDLFVFDPSAAPRGRADFLAWFSEQSEDGECYFVGSSECLRAWHNAMLPNWPDMQEVDDDKVDDPHITGYSCTPQSIYIDFRWSVAEEAYEATRRHAVECRVGFYDVSGDEGEGEIYFPGDELQAPSTGRWRQVSDDFQSGNVSKYIPQDFPKDEPPKRRWFDFFRRDK
ncbi:MAG: hypothetical protein K2Y20_00085 [Sphingomonas sp.]|nr:hypothetical protein [Sphingomonas sp.]